MGDPPRRRGRPGGLTGPALLGVAREVLLERGYAGTSMDEVASRARISKVSLYREHPSKAALFAAVVADWAESGRDAMRPALERLRDGRDVRAGLLRLADALRTGILSTDVLRMRRLVTSEAAAHPQVAAAYLADSWDRNIAMLAEGLAALDQQHQLHVSDPLLAADQFVWLVIGAALNEQLLTGETPRPHTADALESAVDLFLAGYRLAAATP